MNKINQKRENEKRILKVMIDIYQRKHPQESKMCEDLYKYACLRIDKCPFMETKTFCSGCKVHCYQKEYRSQVKKSDALFWKVYAFLPSTSNNQTWMAFT